MDDPRELSSFYGRPASHISSSHYPMGSGHEGDSYSNAQYTPRGPEVPQHSLYAPQSFYDYDLRQPHHQTGWGGVEPHTIASDSPLTYGTLGGSSFPEAPRLTPPPAPAITNNQRLTLAGSLDPTTGIFYRTPEHPRLRTAQACEKCRTRKAKCSGEHPACQRCITRGLVCEYAKEVFDEHGNHAPVYWPQEHGVDHDIAVGGSHLQTNTPPRDGEVEVGQMNYLLQQPFHPAMLELHHPVATIPAQLNMEPGQYQHTQK
ncbi:hypothetical protein PLEOSDRAFT_1086575 [Pleurotus ostreatus PC15]|uniref:Zn(2)-C6 fungal-type domain-containing protein n=1 Tax=Pleurotus ostreatus (strain PC15) TaxID=1137138 RepID=A0A067NGC4_PLEO1|nr:hypothetical protein PLEOSDRAFT_1086575 [Pleurotus ostreatus PC15]